MEYILGATKNVCFHAAASGSSRRNALTIDGFWHNISGFQYDHSRVVRKNKKNALFDYSKWHNMA
jgi:hypothetical protein